MMENDGLPSMTDLWALVQAQREEMAQLRAQLEQQQMQLQKQGEANAALAGQIRTLPPEEPRKRRVTRAGLIKAAAAGVIGVAGVESLRPGAAYATSQYVVLDGPNPATDTTSISATTGFPTTGKYVLDIDAGALGAGNGAAYGINATGNDAGQAVNATGGDASQYSNGGPGMVAFGGRGNSVSGYGGGDGVQAYGGSSNGALLDGYGVRAHAGGATASGVLATQGSPSHPSVLGGVVGATNQANAYGVAGISENGTGVYGESDASGSGVIGVQGTPVIGYFGGVVGATGMSPGHGVVGQSGAGSIGVLGTQGIPTIVDAGGVVGATASMGGHGVVGVGGASGVGVTGKGPTADATGVLGMQGTPSLPGYAVGGVVGGTDATGTGAYGVVGYAANGTGVYAESQAGFGVHAKGFPGFLAEGATLNGANGRGGRFVSEQAQIRLNPSTSQTSPPSTGQAAGDFFVDKNGGLHYYNGSTWKTLA